MEDGIRKREGKRSAAIIRRVIIGNGWELGAGEGGVSAWSYCFRNGLLTVILQLRIPKPEEGTLGFVQSFGISGAQRLQHVMYLTDALLWKNNRTYCLGLRIFTLFKILKITLTKKKKEK